MKTLSLGIPSEQALEGALEKVWLWQWLALGILAVAAFIASRPLAKILTGMAKMAARRAGVPVAIEAITIIRQPLQLTAAVVIFWSGSRALPLTPPAETFVANMGAAVLILCTTWMLYRTVNVMIEFASQRLIAANKLSAYAMLPLGRRTLKVVVSAIAILALLQTFGVNVTTLLAGLGVGGLAIALGAQKTFENFFGGMMVSIDQPVRVGDLCRFGDKEGTVEDVGLRSTQIRTFDRTVITIPNAEFSQMKLENFSKRDKIRLKTTIGLRYDTTTEQLRRILKSLRSMLVVHPQTEATSILVRFVEFGTFSLDVEISLYILTSDSNEFAGVREEIFLKIMDLVQYEGSGFALRSQAAIADGIRPNVTPLT